MCSESKSQSDHNQVFPSKALSFHHNPNGDGRPPKRKDRDLNQTTATKRHCGLDQSGVARTVPTELPWNPLISSQDAGPTEASKTLLEIKYGNTASHGPAPKTRTCSTAKQQRPPVPETMDTLSLDSEPQLKGLLVDHGLLDDDSPERGRFQRIEQASPDGSVTLPRRTYRWSSSVHPHSLDRETYYALPIAVTLSSLPYGLWQRPCELF